MIKITLESKNNHEVENFGKHKLTFDVGNEMVFIRAEIEGKEHEIDFDLDIEEFENLVSCIRLLFKNETKP